MSGLNDPNITHIPRDGGMVRMGSDDLLIVKFYMKSVHNPRLSKEQGRHVFEPKEYVFIQQPGERDNVDQPVNDGHKFRFARQWAQFQKNQEQIPEGTPLHVLFVEPNEVAIPDILNSMGIYTVEQLDGLSATAIGNIGIGGQEWVNKAKAFLDHSRKGQHYHRMDRLVKEQQNRLEVQEQQIAALVKQVDQLLAERYGQSGHPNNRPQSHGSIVEQRYQLPQQRVPEPRIGNNEPAYEMADDMPQPEQLNPDTRPIPVFQDPENPQPRRARRGKAAQEN